MHSFTKVEKFVPFFWLLRLILALIFIISLQSNSNITGPLVVVLAYFLLDLLVVLSKPFRHFGYLIFLVMFSFFLLNALLVNLLKADGENLLDRFGLATQEHVMKCLLLSLLALDLGYALKLGNWSRPIDIGATPHKLHWMSVRKVSWILFCISGLLHLISQIHKTMYVAINGYLSYYSSYVAPIPFIFGFAATIFTFSFVLYLASKPPKTQVYKVAVIYIVLQFFALGYGQRNPGMIAVLIVLFYLSVREIESGRRGEWFPKRLVLGIILALPFLLSFFYVLSYSRKGKEVASVSVLDGAVSLLEQQGGSVRVIAQGFEYREILSQFGPYLFTPIFDIITTNPIYRIFVLEGGGLARNADAALTSGKFDLILTYIDSPVTFAAGGGLGSSYIAELFQDFGYVGVFLGSFSFGVVLSYSRFVYDRPIRLLVVLMVLPAIWYAPRASFFTFVYDIGNISVVLVLSVVFIHIGIAKKFYRPDSRVMNNTNLVLP